MALFFASNRWGDGEGIFEYSKHAKDLLREMIHKEDDGKGEAMFDPSNKIIRFITCVNFSDPSYHLPHFYDLFALWAYEEDREYFKDAARISREYLHKACHPITGLCAEYANYDGTPYRGDDKGNWNDHWHYYSDSYRTISNIGLDYEWFGVDPWQVACANNLQRFFCETVQGKDDRVYQIDGTIEEEYALHPVAIIATNAQASLAANGPYADACVRRFWETPLRTGNRRYYDNCLYMFAMLALSGKYQIIQ